MTEYNTDQSIPITFSNLLDPISVDASFIYNFYVPNEDKEYSPNKRSPINYNRGLVTQDTINSIEARSRGSLKSNVPRFIKLSITPKFPDQGWNSTPVLTEVIREKIINRDGTVKFDNINLEGELQNRYISNPSIVDSAVKERIQRQIYKISESMISDGGIFGKLSDEKISNQLSSMLSDDIDAGMILDALSDTELKGYKFTNEISGERYSRIETRSRVQHRVNFNSDSYRSVVSQLSKSNPFSNYFEVDLLGNSADSAGLLKNRLLDQGLFPSYSRSDPDENKKSRLISVSSLTQPPTQVPLSTFITTCKSYPKVNHIGYIVEKISLSPSGRYETHPALAVLNTLTTEMIDPNVLYGYTYFYRVRQLYLVDLIQVINEGSETSNTVYSVITAVIASSSPPAAKVVAREKEIPLPPGVLIPEFNYVEKNLRLEWAHPPNPSRDIKKYQVFRRKRITDPFEIIAEYDFTDDEYTGFIRSEMIEPNLIKKVRFAQSHHIDKDFDSTSSFIYCIGSVDAHGLCSNYGTQIRVIFDKIKNTISTRIISRSGAPKAYPNYFIDPTELSEFGSDRLIEDVIRDSSHGTLRVYFNPDAYVIQSDDITKPGFENIVLSQESGKYKMQIINLDRQISRTLDISIDRDSSLAELF